MSSIIGSITIPTPALKVKLMTQKFLKNRPVKSTYFVLKKTQIHLKQLLFWHQMLRENDKIVRFVR